MVLNESDEQKLRWQKIKKELQTQLEKKDKVKLSKFDSLKEANETSIIKKREYPVGAESILFEAKKNKDSLDNKQLVNLQISIEKISEILKRTENKVEKPSKDISKSFKDLMQQIPKNYWNELLINFKILQQGEQPKKYETLTSMIQCMNELIEPYSDIFMVMLENNTDEHSLCVALSSSYLVTANKFEETPDELLIIRFSKSQKQIIILSIDELPNEKEKKDLLVSFLLGQNKKFVIANKETKKMAFQKTIANKKLY